MGALLTPLGSPNNGVRLNISAELSPRDSAAPVTTISLSPAVPNGNNGWYTGPVGVSVSAADDGGSGVAETRCVLDPAAPPSAFGDIPAGCSYLGAGADVAGDGQHRVDAASADNAGGGETPVNASLQIDGTPPTVTCASPTPTFQPGSAGGTVGATVSDKGSGPVSASVSAVVSATTPAAHTVTLTGEDDAGNTTTVTCPYLVGYEFSGFAAPLPKTTVKSGSTCRSSSSCRTEPVSRSATRMPQSLVSPVLQDRDHPGQPRPPGARLPQLRPDYEPFQLNLKSTAAMKGANGVSVTVTFGTTVVTSGAVEPFTVR